METWDKYVDLLKPAAELIARTREPDDKQLQAKMFRYLMMNLSTGYLSYFQADADHPDWIPSENSAYLLCATNPDGVYMYTKVDGKGVYRVTGERGNALVVNFCTGKNIIGRAYPPGPSFNNYNLDHLTLNDNTSFEVIFSAERPAGYTGDWRYLNPESEFIVLRQFSYDWGGTHDVRLAIERLDVPPLKPPMSLEETDRNLRELMGGFAERMLRVCQDIEKKCAARGREFINQPVREQYTTSLGCHDESEAKDNYWPQTYWEVLYEIAEDEALILEIELPEKRHYWNIQVTDAFYYQVETIHRQSSLNGHQAVLDADGKFRAVLSLQDPGIANWLDTDGNTYGIMLGRWHRCSSHPMPTITKVKLKDLRQHLPATTPIFTAEERAEQLRRRRIGAQLRRRW